MGKHLKTYSFALAAFALALSGCKGKVIEKTIIQQVPVESNTQSPQKPGSNGTVAIEPAPVQATDNYGVAKDGSIILKRAALDKEHLLRASLVNFERDTALFSGLKSRIVIFKKIGGAIQMFESIKGHKVSESIPTSLVLATFPILAETPEFIKIDFDAGMQKVFIVPSWSVGQTPNTVQTYHHRVDKSFIKKAQITKSNVLYVQQVVALSVTESNWPVQMHGEVRYALNPYNPDKDYEPVESPDDDKKMIRHGYFTVNQTVAEDGTKKFYASRFNPNKPIVFTISSNTPKEYQQAVKDGILYWNKAFGKDIVQAKMGKADVAGPHPDHNVVQWLDWDGAGFARADAQVDPRTGQILNGQVMMTSSWALYGKRLAKQWVDQLPLAPEGEKLIADLPDELFRELDIERPQQIKDKTRYALSLRNFGHSSLCNHSMKEKMSFIGQKVQAAALAGKPELVERIAADTIRDVVAHEIGHVLGLRHNFAGSLAANYPLSQRDAIVAEYVKGGSPKVIPTSSVMEYQLPEESGITGDIIAKGEEALKYDYHAIQNLYLGVPFPEDPNQEFLFCPDGLHGVYADCKRFDIGKNPIEQATYTIKKYYEDLPRLLAYSYVAAKADGRDADKLTLNPMRSATRALGAAGTVVDSIRNSSMLISVFRRFDGPTAEMYSSQIKGMQMKFLSEELKKHGGFKGLFEHLPEGYGTKAREQFMELVSGPMRKGSTFDNKTWEFSDADLQRMSRDVGAYFGGFDFLSKLLRLRVIGAGGDLKDDTGGSTIAGEYRTYLFEQAHNFILEKDMNPQKSSQGFEPLGNVTVYTHKDRQNPKVVPNMQIPVYKHHFLFRAFSAMMLARGRGDDDWGFRERGALSHILRDQQEKAFKGIHMDDIDIARLPKIDGKQTDLLVWAQEFEALQGILSPEKND